MTAAATASSSFDKVSSATTAAEDLVQALLDQHDTEHTPSPTDVDAKDHNGATPLMVAAGLGSAETVRLLLRRGAAVNAADDFGATALHRAAEGGQLEACKLLLANGARGDARDALGVTAAEVARVWGYPDVAELLGHAEPWRPVRTSKGRPPPFNADGTEKPENPRWKREL